MPSDEDVITRAGSVRVMTGFTEQACEALLPPVERALVAYMHDHTIDGQPRQSAATGQMTRVPYPR